MTPVDDIFLQNCEKLPDSEADPKRISSKSNITVQPRMHILLYIQCTRLLIFAYHKSPEFGTLVWPDYLIAAYLRDT